MRVADVDVLIVGAGPTGLALAVQLRRWGVAFRLVDALADRRHESRALAVHARTLELLDAIGCADSLVALGRRPRSVQVHVSEPPLQVPVGRVEATGTRFPFVLVVSQAQTEAVLASWLGAQGVAVERGVSAAIEQVEPDQVRCRLTRVSDGAVETIAARYVVGCDGAHSMVRHTAGIPFDGDAYPQRFLLADLEVDGLDIDAAHAFPGADAALLALPLGTPRTWRVIGIDGAGGEGEASTESPLALHEVQAFADRVVPGRLRLRDPIWLTRFRLHHRQAARYREGRLFLAGDAAHIHSPAGGQGMNTGIQDAWNLGWKLALVCRGMGPETWLDTYHDERHPVGAFLLRFTDRLFTVATRAVAAGARWQPVRGLVLRALIPLASIGRLRGRAFHMVSQLGIRYRSSPAVLEGASVLTTGPQAGDRLPNLPVTVDGTTTSLQALIAPARFHLLCCGAAGDMAGVETLIADRPLARHAIASADQATRDTLAALGVDGRRVMSALYLVRPDGHIAYRCAGHDTAELDAWLERWLPRSAAR
jgi:2-polyprenyl-6-methoxyphenol hydroxylase-like FAD-dependent oxidoreductase